MTTACAKWGKRAAALALLSMWCMAVRAEAAGVATGEALVRTYCSGCHAEHQGRFDRISSIRKTPEGWVMTLFRMRQVHGLALGDDVQSALVQYLADTQGLAPSEAQPGRFALERRPNVQDVDLGPKIGIMCGRCHSLARVALQRRDAHEWLKLAHMHLGQWPSIEYQASGRDRPWWQIASTELPATLAGLFPFESTAWKEWHARPVQDLTGSWVVVGHAQGGGDFYGTAEIDRQATGAYVARYALKNLDGMALAGESHALLYTGYEWRGRAEVAGSPRREVFAVSEDGTRIVGRWFDAAHAELGGDWSAIRAGGPARVLAVLPRALRIGTSSTVTVVGAGLGTAELSLGAGTRARILSRTPNFVRAEVIVAGGSEPGERPVSVGAASIGQGLALYRRIDRIEVLPAYGIARLGGGQVAPVSAQFEAIAAERLPDGRFLTLGPVAATWRAEPFDAEAARSDDVKFAGRLDGNGRYQPAGAGPDPVRQFSGDNVGNLSILAQVQEGDRTIEGRSHLIVTVQRWNTPPIY